jgi:hypothetical protein
MQPENWGADPIARGFRNPLAVMLAAANTNAGGNATLLERLNGLLKFWEEKGIYDNATMGSLRQSMLVPDPRQAVSVLPPLPPLPASSLETQQQVGAHQQPYGGQWPSQQVGSHTLCYICVTPPSRIPHHVLNLCHASK